MTSAPPAGNRTVVFISKATPEDDEFVLWLAPKLEAAGYEVFADILVLQAGDRWRKTITNTLQDRAVKMLLCCRDTTLAKDGVQEEIGIGLDLAKSLKDPKFVIPLRLEQYKKVFGIGELQYIDFVRGWAEGLAKLLETLRRQNVPCNKDSTRINPNWEAFRRRNSLAIKQEPERLTSNWLRIVQAPDAIRYYEPTGAIDRMALKRLCDASPYPMQSIGPGFLTFCDFPEISEYFVSFGKVSVKHEFPLLEFVAQGVEQLGLARQDASNIVTSMWRQAWNRFCRDRGLREYAYSSSIGFHASKSQIEIGKKIPWGKQGERRSSMLRNVAKGQVWEYGVTALPASWPFPHFKLKSRVLFSPLSGTEAGAPIDDSKKQHRLRRSVCKGWRNKQWYGRMLAFLELLSQDSAYVYLPLGGQSKIKLEASPILFTSPVSTELPNILGDDQEEVDETTLGRPDPEEEP